MQVSHETIYLPLFVQARGALRRELIGHLRRVRSMRRPKSARLQQPRPGADRQMRYRSAIVPAEARGPGGPRPLGGRSSGRGAGANAIASLVERSSRY